LNQYGLAAPELGLFPEMSGAERRIDLKIQRKMSGPKKGEIQAEKCVNPSLLEAILQIRRKGKKKGLRSIYMLQIFFEGWPDRPQKLKLL
jgi:hypothetical protein